MEIALDTETPPPSTRVVFENQPVVERDRSAPVQGVDPRRTTPEANFCSSGAARWLNVIYEDLPDKTVVWQPDVLWEARNIADLNGISQIVDIGCGTGDKLIRYFGEGDYDTVGIDFHDAVTRCRARYPGKCWLPCDLTSYDDLRRVSPELDFGRPAVYVLSDVIEHLTDPRPLVAWVRTRLLEDPGSRFVVSTPDRLLLGYENDSDRPQNKSHIREWSIDELEAFFDSSGFQVIRSGHTRANQFDEEYTTLFVELTCSKTHYSDFLKTAGLTFGEQDPEHVLLTTEFAGFHSTGGIGSFVAEQRDNYGHEKTICLLGAGANIDNVERLRKFRLLTPGSLLTVKEPLLLEDQFLEAVQHLLFYFPRLRTVQYADYMGFGCRIAQGKQSGLLPESVTVIAHCHGLTHYLENAQERWLGPSHIGIAEKEKLSVERADLVVFPTTFLRRLYAECGILVPAERTLELRYPYRVSLSETRPCERVDTLLFFGKRSRMKGFNLFLRAMLDEAAAGDALSQIANICIIGPLLDDGEAAGLVAQLRQRFHVEELSCLGRDAAMLAVRERADRSIIVMPYLADNHPYALLDVVFAGGLPLMVRAGGVPELFPDWAAEYCLAEPDAASLRRAIDNLLVAGRRRFDSIRGSLTNDLLKSQAEINLLAEALPLVVEPLARRAASGQTTIIVPVFNTPLGYIEELVFSINNQTVRPAEVIFVDDASNEGYGVELAALVSEQLATPHRVLRHESNKGLAGARNTGLAATRTEYVINVDSDDVPMNDFVRDIVFTLESDPRNVAAVPFLRAFDDGTDFNAVRFGGYVYRPIGEGVIASQLDNLLGHANSGYRTSVVAAAGGWDESSKSMWEDWALYLRLASQGHRIAVIPKVCCLYRVRPKSMLRTYKVWPAMRRLAVNMEGLPRFENFRLQAVLRSHREAAEEHPKLLNAIHQAHQQNAALQQQNAALHQQMSRRSVRAVTAFADRSARHPRLLRFATAAGLAAWKLGRLVRRVLRMVVR